MESFLNKPSGFNEKLLEPYFLQKPKQIAYEKIPADLKNIPLYFIPQWNIECRYEKKYIKKENRSQEKQTVQTVSKNNYSKTLVIKRKINIENRSPISFSTTILSMTFAFAVFIFSITVTLIIKGVL